MLLGKVRVYRVEEVSVFGDGRRADAPNSGAVSLDRKIVQRYIATARGAGAGFARGIGEQALHDQLRPGIQRIRPQRRPLSARGAVVSSSGSSRPV